MPKVNQVVPIGGTQYDVKSTSGHHQQTPTHGSSTKDDTFSLTTMDRRFSVTTGKTLSDSVTSQTILKKQVFSSQTIVGLLEKIPLSLKLILVVVFAILSLCVFGALLIVNSVKQINSADQIQNLAEFSVLISDLVHCIQVSRVFILSVITRVYTWIGLENRENVVHLRSIWAHRAHSS